MTDNDDLVSGSLTISSRSGNMTAALSETAVPLVSVVITTYNDTHFLADAIESVIAQSISDKEIVVVDDGSADQASELVSQFAGVRYIWQVNAGLSAARNVGLKESRGRYVVFLDADDRLLPGALLAGLSCFSSYPESAFVSGRHLRISEDGRHLGRSAAVPLRRSHYTAFLQGNYVGMHAAVMYRRDVLQSVGGFNVSLPACEDYDMFLRISRRYPVARHDQFVAEYRIHGANMSADAGLMLSSALRVLRTQREHVMHDLHRRKAFKEGERNWRRHYGKQLLAARSFSGRRRQRWPQTMLKAWMLLHTAPQLLPVYCAGAARRCVRTVLARHSPRLVGELLRGMSKSDPPLPKVGRMHFGDFRRLTPVSRNFGFDRGCPIDRHYIEAFLQKHANAIRGRVLEIGDDVYTMRFGGDRVIRSDVLHAVAENPKATFVDDLASGETLPSSGFDCVILTQTLHLIYDVKAALATLGRILKPGGVLLMTIPGTISQVECGKWAESWHWGFTALSISKLCAEAFAEDKVEVGTHGSVLTSIAFLHGLAAGELDPSELDHHDPLYPLLITVRVRKLDGPPDAAGPNIHLPSRLNGERSTP